MGNNVDFNIGIDNISDILYKGAFAVFGKQKLLIIIIKKKGSIKVHGLIAIVNMQNVNLRKRIDCSDDANPMKIYII